jgi:hypothetical protein
MTILKTYYIRLIDYFDEVLGCKIIRSENYDKKTFEHGKQFAPDKWIKIEHEIKEKKAIFRNSL